jgi:Fibronectin type III domain
MNFYRFVSTTACICLFVLTLSSCMDPIGVGTVIVPTAVSNLQATSIDETTVRLRWTGNTSATITGYKVNIVSSSGTILSTVTPTGSLVDIGGLTAGRVYTFKVQARSKDTVSTESVITWSPATRIRTANSNAVLMYESVSSFGSGLSFQGGIARNLSIANANDWDIALDTQPTSAGNSYDIGSPNKTGYTAFANNGGRRTIVSSLVYNSIDSLNQVFDTQLNVGGDERLINFTTANRGFVFACRTQNGNYAKVFVKASNQGVILQGTAPNRYLEVEISYQPVANVPFAYRLDKAAAAIINSEMNTRGLFFVDKKIPLDKY